MIDTEAQPPEPAARVEPSPSDGSEGGGAPSSHVGRTVPAGAFVVAVMVAMALGVLAVVALALDSNSSDGDGDRAIRLAAGRFTERFLTFEHDGLDQWKADVLRLSTGGFAEEVEEVESGLRRIIADTEQDAITQVTDLFVGEVERGAVDVVVIYDRELRGVDGARTETARYMQLSLLSIDGEWLVDDVIDVATVDAFSGADSDRRDPSSPDQPSPGEPEPEPAPETDGP